MLVELPEGITIDPAAKRLTVLGVDVIVAWAMCWVTTGDGLVNMTILCGENGWYVDLAMHVYGEDAGEMYATPADWQYGDDEAQTAEELVDLIAEVSCRTRPVPSWVDDPYCGTEPGSWISFDCWDWPAEVASGDG